MEITINKGTKEAIVDIEDILDLLEYKVVALRLYKYEYSIDVNERLIDTLDSYSRLQEYLLSLCKE